MRPEPEDWGHLDRSHPLCDRLAAGKTEALRAELRAMQRDAEVDGVQALARCLNALQINAADRPGRLRWTPDSAHRGLCGWLDEQVASLSDFLKWQRKIGKLAANDDITLRLRLWWLSEKDFLVVLGYAPSEEPLQKEAWWAYIAVHLPQAAMAMLDLMGRVERVSLRLGAFPSFVPEPTHWVGQKDLCSPQRALVDREYLRGVTGLGESPAVIHQARQAIADEITRRRSERQARFQGDRDQLAANMPLDDAITREGAWFECMAPWFLPGIPPIVDGRRGRDRINARQRARALEQTTLADIEARHGQRFFLHFGHREACSHCPDHRFADSDRIDGLYWLSDLDSGVVKVALPRTDWDDQADARWDLEPEAPQSLTIDLPATAAGTTLWSLAKRLQAQSPPAPPQAARLGAIACAILANLAEPPRA